MLKSIDEKLKEIKSLGSVGDFELLNAYSSGELEYWEGGNADDTFNLGIDVGWAMALKKVIEIINQ